MAQSIFIPKATTADLAALDYFTGADFVYNAGSGPGDQLNNHLLADFPQGDTNGYFPGVMGEDYGGGFITVNVFWIAKTAVAGNVQWFVAFERDAVGVDINADSYAAEKSVVSTAPATAGIIQKATVSFSAAEAAGIVGGDPYRLRIRRDSGMILDTMSGVAQVFRTSLIGVP